MLPSNEHFKFEGGDLMFKRSRGYLTPRSMVTPVMIVFINPDGRGGISRNAHIQMDM